MHAYRLSAVQQLPEALRRCAANPKVDGMLCRSLLLMLSLLYATATVAAVWCCPWLEWALPTDTEAFASAGCPHHAPLPAVADAVDLQAGSDHGACCCPAPLPMESRLNVIGIDGVDTLHRRWAGTPPSMPFTPPLRPPATHS